MFLSHIREVKPLSASDWQVIRGLLHKLLGQWRWSAVHTGNCLGFVLSGCLNMPELGLQHPDRRELVS